jgi:hypothetical protein
VESLTLARWQPSLLLRLDLLLVTVISSLSIAQTTTSGGLTGVVADPSGAVVVDVEVETKKTSKGSNPIRENWSRGSLPVLLLGTRELQG